MNALRDAHRENVAGRVEPGVTGKEKLFQQSREFGPGPIKPYPDGARSGAPNANRRTSDGVYRGKSRPRTTAV